MKRPKVVALVPARSGSKGFPQKNIHPFLNKPLLAWSVIYAIESGYIQDCFVSTDDQNYLDISLKYGARKLPLRSKHLALDSTPMWDVIRDFCKTPPIYSAQYDYLVLLEPTSPLRKIEDLIGSLELLEANPNWAGVVSVSEPHFNPIWVSVTVQEHSQLITRWIEDSGKYTGRQQVPRLLRMNSLLYVWRMDFIEVCKSYWLESGLHGSYVTPEWRSLSIDTEMDFRMAETIAKSSFFDLNLFRK